MGVNAGKPSSQRPTKSLSLRLRNSKRCAASCMSAANCACARPMSKNAAIQTNQLSSHTAATTMPMVCAYNNTTAKALRTFGMRRSSSRNSRRGPRRGADGVGRRGTRRGKRSRGASSRRPRLHITLSQQMSQHRKTPLAEPDLNAPFGPLAGRQPAAALPAAADARRPARAVVRAVRRRRGHGPRRAEPHGRTGRARRGTTVRTSWRGGSAVAGPRRTGASRRELRSWKGAVANRDRRRGRPFGRRTGSAARRDAPPALCRAARGRVDAARQPAAGVGYRGVVGRRRRAVPVVAGSPRRRRVGARGRAVRRRSLGRACSHAVVASGRGDV